MIEGYGIDLASSGPCWISPQASSWMRSRLEVLAPGESVGRHVTTDREEVIIILRGRARLEFDDRTYAVGSPRAIYIPPRTPHDIANDGDEELRYVFVVALHDGGKGGRAGTR